MSEIIPPILLAQIRTWSEKILESQPLDEWERGYQAAYCEILSRFFLQERVPA